MNTSPRRFRRGDTSPERPGKVFLSYNGAKEQWVTPERLERAKSDGLKRVREWAARQKKKWAKGRTLNKKHARGDTSSEHPGLIFWGMLRGKEWWVTPQKFEAKRLQKNKAAKKYKPSEASKRREAIRQKERQQTPAFRARAAAFQRKKRHIYSPRGRVRRRAYKKMRLATDPAYRLAANLSSRMRGALKFVGGKKNSPTQTLIGCTHQFFRGWLEAQFVEGMSWDNYGKTWSVDHIKPVVSFDLLDENEQRKAFHYLNCRPLFKEANCSKSDRIEFEGRTVRAGHLRKANIIPFTKQEAA